MLPLFLIGLQILISLGHFYLAVFKVFSVSLLFQQFGQTVSGCVFLNVYSAWNLLSLLDVQTNILLNLGCFRHYFFKQFFSAPIFFSSLTGFPIHIFFMQSQCATVLCDSVYFNLLFFSFFFRLLNLYWWFFEFENIFLLPTEIFC